MKLTNPCSSPAAANAISMRVDHQGRKHGAQGWVDCMARKANVNAVIEHAARNLLAECPTRQCTAHEWPLRCSSSAAAAAVSMQVGHST